MISRHVVFAAGRTFSTASVRIVGDRVVEADETFDFTLSNAGGAAIGDGAGTYPIVNDD